MTKMKPPLFLASVIVKLIARTAFAQEPTALFTSPWPLAPNPQLATPTILTFGEPSAGNALPPWMASVPLRLSLQSPIFPTAGGYPNCTTREDASGNSFNGWPVQRYALLAVTPNLVLHGFTSAGCPVDGAIGGGVTYTVPLQPSWWLVMGGGMYGVPAHDSIPARRSADVRIDVMKKIDDRRSVSVGLGRRGVSLGGSW
jgi:hypothetical protein